LKKKQEEETKERIARMRGREENMKNNTASCFNTTRRKNMHPPGKAWQ
jgi:hypothetical protein